MTDQLKFSSLHAGRETGAALADTAMQWLMRVSDSDANTDAGAAMHAACAQWRAADPAHEQAFRDAQRFWQRDELALALAQSLLQPAASRPAGNLRPLGLALAALLALAILAGGAYLLPVTRQLGDWALADRQAPLRAIATTQLDDGSRIMLDAGAAIDVAYTASLRRLTLRRGTIVVDAMPDAARPMVIESGAATVSVLGTRFLVARAAEADRIDVQSGRVAVQGHAGGDTRLAGGQRVAAGQSGLGAIETIDPNSVADFAAGWRSFEAAPLSAVLAEIGRYRWAPILLADTGIGGLPVTARLQVTEPERALAALLATMPLQMQVWPGGLVRIGRQP